MRANCRMEANRRRGGIAGAKADASDSESDDDDVIASAVAAVQKATDAVAAAAAAAGAAAPIGECHLDYSFFRAFSQRVPPFHIQSSCLLCQKQRSSLYFVFEEIPKAH